MPQNEEKDPENDSLAMENVSWPTVDFRNIAVHVVYIFCMSQCPKGKIYKMYKIMNKYIMYKIKIW